MTVEILFIQTCLCVYVIGLLFSVGLIVYKKKPVPYVELISHGLFVLILARLLRISGSSDSFISIVEVVLIVIFTACATFLLGIKVGKTIHVDSERVHRSSHSHLHSRRAHSAVKSVDLDPVSSGKKIKFKSKVEDQFADSTPPAPLSEGDPNDMDDEGEVEDDDYNMRERILSEDSDDVHFVPASSNSGYEDVIEKAKSTLMSMVGLSGYPGSLEYSNRAWTLVQSGSTAHVWMSKAKSDGLLVRATCVVNTPAKAVYKWLLDKDLGPGIESLAYRTEIQKLFHDGNIIVRRISCKAGSITSSNRDFMLVTSSSVYPDGTYIIASRSTVVPDSITSSMRKTNRNGYIRGILYGSGYVLRPVQCADGIGCELFFAVHLDMLGNASGHTNSSKIDRLIGSVLSVFDKIKGGSARSALDSAGGSSGDLTLFKKRSANPSMGQIGLSQSQLQDLQVVATSAALKLRQLLRSSMANQVGGSGAAGAAAGGGGAGDTSVPAQRRRSSLGVSMLAWDTFYDQDGIRVSEQTDNIRPVGVLNASCSVDAPPAAVRSLLLEKPDLIDGLLAGRTVLNRLNKTTYVQWLAYRNIWPIGARDFLLITTEEPYDEDSGEGFVIASTSIDEICEVVDGDDDENDEADAERKAQNKVDAKSREVSEFSRSKLRLAGYVGTPNKSGGTDLHLFVDMDAYSYTPAWLVQVLSQYGLAEMMSRIRKATQGHPPSAQPFELDKIISRIQTRDARIRQLQEETISRDSFGSSKAVASIDTADSARQSRGGSTASAGSSVSLPISRRASEISAGVAGGSPGGGSSAGGSDGGSPKKGTSRRHSTMELPSNKAALEGSGRLSFSGGVSSSSTSKEASFAAGGGSSPRLSTGVGASALALAAVVENEEDVEEDKDGKLQEKERSVVSPASTTESAFTGDTDTDVTAGASAGAGVGNDGSAAPIIPATPAAPLTPGQMIAEKAKKLFLEYLGLVRNPALGLEWQMKGSKSNVTVEASMVEGNTWQAIRAKTFMQAPKEKIMRFLLDDNRIGEFDDMFDFCKFIEKVDDRTSIRRMCFKAIWPTAPRDFIACSTWTERDDGSLMICTRSATDEAMAPQKGYVRGFIQISGYWIQPVETLKGDAEASKQPPGSCKVTLTAHTELGGTLPSSVINMLSTAAPLKMMSAISEIVKR